MDVAVGSSAALVEHRHSMAALIRRTCLAIRRPSWVEEEVVVEEEEEGDCKRARARPTMLKSEKGRGTPSSTSNYTV